MVITIKGELPDLNTYINSERKNKYAAAKLKKNWTDMITWEIKAQKPKKLKKEVAEVIIDWYTKSFKKDADNVVFAKKFLLDALVKAEVIPNDSRKYITAFSEKVYVDKNNPRVEVELA